MASIKFKSNFDPNFSTTSKRSIEFPIARLLPSFTEFFYRLDYRSSFFSSFRPNFATTNQNADKSCPQLDCCWSGLSFTEFYRVFFLMSFDRLWFLINSSNLIKSPKSHQISSNISTTSKRSIQFPIAGLLPSFTEFYLLIDFCLIDFGFICTVRRRATRSCAGRSRASRRSASKWSRAARPSRRRPSTASRRRRRPPPASAIRCACPSTRWPVKSVAFPSPSNWPTIPSTNPTSGVGPSPVRRFF